MSRIKTPMIKPAAHEYVVYPIDGSPIRSYPNWKDYEREETKLANGDRMRLANIRSMRPLK